MLHSKGKWKAYIQRTEEYHKTRGEEEGATRWALNFETDTSSESDQLGKYGHDHALRKGPVRKAHVQTKSCRPL